MNVAAMLEFLDNSSTPTDHLAQDYCLEAEPLQEPSNPRGSLGGGVESDATAHKLSYRGTSPVVSTPAA